MTNELINYDTACRSLAMAAKIDEVLNIRDQASAMKAYARVSKNKDLEIHAMEIRIRAERKLGELIIKQKEATGLAAGGRPKKTPQTESRGFSEGEETPQTESRGFPEDDDVTLGDMGIDYNLSSRSQKLAAVPDDEFEQTLEDRRQDISAANAKAVNKLEKAGRKAQQRKAKTTEPPSIEVEALQETIADLQDRISGLARDLEEAIEDNQSLARIVESGDIAKAAEAEAKRFREMNRILDARINGLMTEKNEAIRAAKHWKGKFERLEKIAKALGHSDAA